MTWIVPPIWTGTTCYILGCGYSLASTPTKLLSGRHVIAVNDSYIRYPSANVLYFCDGQKWWNDNCEEVREHFRGHYIVTSHRDSPPPKIPGVCVLRLTEKTGLETDPGMLRHGANSGYQAINLAFHFGARRIVLLGMDMHATNGYSHWRRRNREPSPHSFHQILQRHMLPNFPSLVTPLQEAGVEVLNCTPGSALQCWPMRDLHEVLQEEDRLC